jgi:triosephosphate isomerase
MKYFMANWKMNGDRSFWYNLAEQTAEQAKKFKADRFVVFPPFVALADVENALFEADKNMFLGAQDVSDEESGAFTSQVSADMLKGMGCSYVLVGHSECREYLGQPDELLALKVKAAQEKGLKVVLCIGETLDEYENKESIQVVVSQLEKCLKASKSPELLAVAYEPVWAIGTGKVATVEDIKPIFESIKKTLLDKFGAKGDNVALLYGGSVKADNATEIFSVDEINGVLVGGASLDATSFVDIARSAQF